MCGAGVVSFIAHRCLLSVLEAPIPGRKSRSISWACSSQLATIRFYFAQESPTAPPPYFSSRMPAKAYDLSDHASLSTSADVVLFSSANYSVTDDRGSDLPASANADVLSIATASHSDQSSCNGSGQSFDLLREEILRPYSSDANASVARDERILIDEVLVMMHLYLIFLFLLQGRAVIYLPRRVTLLFL
jgi:hypothetical protein